jgi:quercetin 2,3-dioxygenase
MNTRPGVCPPRKMMEPRYRDVRREQIPEVSLEGGVTVKIICGEVNGVRGPVRDIVIDPEYLDVSVPALATFTHPVNRGHSVFAYVIEGKGSFDDGRDAIAHEVVGKSYFDLDRQCVCANGTLIPYGDGDHVSIIGEPVAWYRPIVMNTQEELRDAFDEYRRGTFIKRKAPARE